MQKKATKRGHTAPSRSRPTPSKRRPAVPVASRPGLRPAEKPGPARAVPFEPARSLLTTTADLTRDVAAVQISGARWLLDA